MFELHKKPKQINGFTPYLYGRWYCGNSKVLNYVEYIKRPFKIVSNLSCSRGAQILDIGCDFGYLLMWIKHKFKHVDCIGIDICKKSVNFGNELSKINGYDIELEYGSAFKMRFEDNFFDVIVSSETFEHIVQNERINCLKECYRVLKSGGVMLVTTPNKYGIAEIVKKTLGRIDYARKVIPMLPNSKTDKTGWVVDNENNDIMVNDAESIGSLRKKVKEVGFEILQQEQFLFIPEITPNFLFKIMLIIESFFEKLRIFNCFATSQFIMFRKP